MKTRMLGVLAASTLIGAALTTTTLAQDRQGSFDGRGAGPTRGVHAPLRGKMRGGLRDNGALAQTERFITRMDTDADGRVSSAEFIDGRLQQVDRYFERRDTDGDGLIAADEYATPRTRPERGARPERPAIDEEALGACVRETIADFEPRRGAAPDDIFAAADTDADGAVSLQELSAALEGRAQEQFARLDADGDGYLTSEDADAQRQERLELRRTTRACLQEQRTD